MRIPEKRIDENLPGVRGPRPSGMGDALSAVGRGVQQMGQVVDAIRERNYRKDQQNFIDNWGIELDGHFREFEADVFSREGAHALSASKDIQKFADRHRKQWIDRAGDQETREILERIYDRRLEQSLDRAIPFEIDKRRLETERTDANVIESETREAVRTGSVDAIGAAVGSSIARLVRSNPDMTDAEREDKTRDLYDRNIIAVIEAKAADDPAASVDFWESNKDAFSKVMSTDKLTSVQKKMGLLREVAGKQEELKKRLEQQQETAALNSARQQWSNQAWIKYMNGQLTYADVVASPLEPFGENSKETWVTLLDSLAKGRVNKKSDPGLYISLLADVMNGDITDPNAAYYFASKLQGLSIKDAELIKVFAEDSLREENKHRMKLYKAAVDMGKDVIGVGTILTGADGFKIQDVYEYEHALRQALGIGEKDGKRYEDMLSPGHKDYIVESILQPYLLSPRERIRLQAEKIRRTEITADGKTGQSNEIKRREGETPEEYLKRVRR